MTEIWCIEDTHEVRTKAVDMTWESSSQNTHRTDEEDSRRDLNILLISCWRKGFVVVAVLSRKEKLNWRFVFQALLVSSHVWQTSSTSSDHTIPSSSTEPKKETTAGKKSKEEATTEKERNRGIKYTQCTCRVIQSTETTSVWSSAVLLPLLLECYLVSTSGVKGLLLFHHFFHQWIAPPLLLGAFLEVRGLSNIMRGWDCQGERQVQGHREFRVRTKEQEHQKLKTSSRIYSRQNIEDTITERQLSETSFLDKQEPMDKWISYLGFSKSSLPYLFCLEDGLSYFVCTSLLYESHCKERSMI